MNRGQSATDAEDPAPANAAGPPGDGGAADAPTVGAEEEYLLVDPVTRAVSPEAGKVVAAASAELGNLVTTEITRYQVEVRTDPHTSLADFAAQIRSLRSAVSRAAADNGLAVVSSGTPVLEHPLPPPVTDGRRYARSVARFGALDDEQSVCACHLHVAMPDLDTALMVSNHIRCWLPVVVALSANSPFWQGRDTRYASWRTMTWARWPAAGPPPHFASRAHFEDLVADLIDSETVLDRGGLYWDIRPSHHVPTLEIRAADAAATTEDLVLLAAVVRALVAMALTDVAAGVQPARPDAGTLRSACWRAARDGLTGRGLDLGSRRLTPMTALVDRLLAHIRPALERHGDLHTVTAGWKRLRALGNGAVRQRTAGRRSPVDAVDHLIREF
ncbi:carboxylate-amine ligase [Streptomyces cadmiisoli]|uniref:carboxylate-amine ligase n=1 Tax=Streptomyces cadmiisoli TaxID=2184053 RepID=UPI003652CE44